MLIHTLRTQMSTRSSYWLYMHPELQGKPNYWKVGKTLTPYSAVRSRQRHMVDDFYLTALWFGHPDDVDTLEYVIHSIYRPTGNNKLGSGRGELVYYNAEQEGCRLDTAIQRSIDIRGADMKRMYTGNARGYHATNSTQCVFNCVQEKDAHEWSRLRIKEMFNTDRRLVKPKSIFAELFE